MECKKKIHLKRLKAFAKRELRPYVITHEILLHESDDVGSEEFMIKMGIWLQILDREIRSRRDFC